MPLDACGHSQRRAARDDMHMRAVNALRPYMMPAATAGN